MKKLSNVKKGVILGALILPLALFILAILTVSVFMVVKSKPSGDFQGHWEGGIILADPEKQQIGPLPIEFDIDEQSGGYGHIRLRILNPEVNTDMIVPCHFNGKNFSAETESLTITGSTLVDHGTAYMDFSITIILPEDRPSSGKGSVQRTMMQFSLTD